MIWRLLLAVVLLVVVVGGIVGFNMFRAKMIAGYLRRHAAAAGPRSRRSTPSRDLDARHRGDRHGRAPAGRRPGRRNRRHRPRASCSRPMTRSTPASIWCSSTTRSSAPISPPGAGRARPRRRSAAARNCSKKGVGSDVVLDTAQAAATAPSAQVKRSSRQCSTRRADGAVRGHHRHPADRCRPVRRARNDGCATLQDLDKMRVDFTVPEQQLGMLEIGQPVDARHRAMRRCPFRARSSASIRRSIPQPRLVSVRAEVDNPGGELSPGQFVRVRVELPEENDVIAAAADGAGSQPLRRLQSSSSSRQPPKPAERASRRGASRRTAPRQAAARRRQVFVKTGRRARGQVEILSGLAGRRRGRDRRPEPADATARRWWSTTASSQPATRDRAPARLRR